MTVVVSDWAGTSRISPGANRMLKMPSCWPLGSTGTVRCILRSELQGTLKIHGDQEQ